MKKGHQLMLDPATVEEVVKIQKPLGGKISTLVQYLLEEWVTTQRECAKFREKLNQKLKDKMINKKIGEGKE